MKTFEMKADVTFEAEDIDNAILKLGEHFAKLYKSINSDEAMLVEEDHFHDDFEYGESLFTSGQITVKPLGGK